MKSRRSEVSVNQENATVRLPDNRLCEICSDKRLAFRGTLLVMRMRFNMRVPAIWDNRDRSVRKGSAPIFLLSVPPNTLMRGSSVHFGWAHRFKSCSNWTKGCLPLFHPP